MAPNKKKKKATTNPLRGFATVSRPSKVKEDREEIDAVLNKTAVDITQDRGSKKQRKPDTSKLISPKTIDTSSMTPEQFESHLEDSDLQNMVDAHASRCRQDAARQVSRLQIERRQLRNNTSSHRLATASWLDDETAERLVMNCINAITPCASSTGLDVSIAATDSLILQLWTLNLTLVSLELPDPDKAIDHVLLLATKYKFDSGDYIWGLREALEWYAVHCPHQDLPDYEQGAVATFENLLQAKESDRSFEPQLTLSEVSTEPEHKEFVDKPWRAEKEKEEEERKEEEVAEATEAMEAVLLVSTGDDHTKYLEDRFDDEDGNEDEDDPSEFADRYLRLQTSLYNITCLLEQQHSPSLQNQARSVKSKIQTLRRDPLFDLDAAERLWRPRQRELEIEQARSTKAKASERSGRGDTKVDSAEEDNDFLGSIFGTEDEEHAALASTEPTSIRLFDFGDSAGTQPRKLMEECVYNIDSRANFSFRKISTSQYSNRQSLILSLMMKDPLDKKALDIVPEGIVCHQAGGSLELEMVSVATASPSQAEGFLSTIVLFLLSISGLSEQNLHNRLPTIWRNLYQELVEQRDVLVDEADKVMLKGLRNKVNRIRHEFNDIAQESSYPPGNNDSDRVHQHSRFQPMSSDAVRELWHAKSSTSSFTDMLKIRTALPVHHYKDYVLENFQQQQIMVICADTGAGKSTQIPSFVLEHEMSNGRDCNVFVTQPRRISAISLARRVSQELGEAKTDLGTDRSLVGYAIRLETKVSRSTRITFATTGVLLRMIESTPELEEIGCIILDEVHERTMDLDLLFIALRKLMKRRAELKVILMSATVDAQKFATYFDGAPVLSIPGRTFPVDVKYLEDAIEETHDIHPLSANSFEADQDLLDESENDTHAATFLRPASGTGSTLLSSDEYSSKTISMLARIDEYRIDYELIAKLLSAIATKPKFSHYSSAILVFMPGIAEMKRLQNIILSNDIFSSGWVIHLLHSSFSTEDLERAFKIPPVGQRKIVISTNIAETGITIPDVTAVIDTCKEKIMRFDERRQLSRLTEAFISRSSARQRKGRAARVRAGLCFHLVTKQRYNNIMLEQHVPEMLRLSLQDAILRIKIWNFGSIETTLCSAIDPPSLKNIRRAVEKLKDAGALNAKEDLTPLGKHLARLPLEIVLGKMAIFGIMFKCLDSVVTMVAALSSKSPFQVDKGNVTTDPRIQFSRSDSDLISLLSAYQGWRKAKEAGVAHQFCRKHRLSDQNLMAIEDQKVQLLVYLVDAEMVSLEPHEKITLNKSRSSGHRKYFFTVPKRFNCFENDALLCTIIAGSFYPRLLVREGKGWRNVYTNQHMALTSSSVNKITEKPPKWLSFYEAIQGKSGALNVHGTTRIPEVAIITFIGEATFKFYSGVIVLDNGKMRFSLRQWRQLAAIKVIRDHITHIMTKCWQSPRLTMAASDEAWIETFVTLVAGQNTKTK